MSERDEQPGAAGEVEGGAAERRAPAPNPNVDEHELELRRESLRATALLGAVRDFAATATRAGDITTINEAGLRLIGRDWTDPRPLTLESLHDAETARRLREEHMETARVSGHWEGELRLQHSDGTAIPVAYHLAVLPLPGGDEELLIVAHDLTQTKRAATVEERLVREMSELKTVIDSTSDFVAMADLDGRISYVNPTGMAMCGRQGQSFVGLTIPDFQPPEDVRRLVEEVFPRVVETGRAWHGEMRFCTKDQELIPVSQVITIVRDEQGGLVGYATIARNIAERKRAEAERERLLDRLRASANELRAAKESAEAANRAKSVFLANMSHELRTPLNAILGFTQLLQRDGVLSELQRERVQIISSSGEHLLSLINDVLEMSKIEAGRTILSVEGFDLFAQLGELERMFRLRAESKGLELVFERAVGTPRFISTDGAKLKQVLINLIGNAIKFTTAGSVRVSVVPCAAPGRLRFAIIDTGPGIAKEDQETLFQAFVQTATGLKSQEGTGLGLSISREYVRLMGGDFEVYSERGQGATFAFEIDYTEDDGANAIAAPEREVIGLLPGQPSPRVLIVEDRALNRQLLNNMLRPLGFTLREATNGQEALDALDRWTPDVILMDMRMPVMNGYEATRRIRLRDDGARPVIIAITASAFEEDRSKMLSIGCDDFVRKPFKQRAVLECMARHLGLRFLHRDELQRTVQVETPTRAIDELMAATSVAWRRRLLEATLRADYEVLLALSGEVADAHPTLATALEELIHDFEYDELMELLEGSGVHEGG